MTFYKWRMKTGAARVFRRAWSTVSRGLTLTRISRTITATGFVCAFAACAGTSDVTPEATPRAEVEQKTDGVTPETFTTAGKPTKTIETPWGPREIYDPAQDPEIKRSVKLWNDAGVKQYDSLKDEYPQKYSYYHSAMQTHKLDMMRLGCELPEVRFHWFDDALRQRYMEAHPTCKPAFGNPEPSVCEATKMKNDKINYSRRYHGNEFKYAGFGFNYGDVGIGSKGTIAYSDDAEKSVKIFTDISCIKWVGIRDTFGSYEVVAYLSRDPAAFTIFPDPWPNDIYLDEFCAKLEPEIRSQNKFCGTYPVPQLRGWPDVPIQQQSTQE